MTMLLQRVMRRSALLALAASMCAICFLPAKAGSPPLITDDPETPGAHGWEINITSSIESSRDGTLVEAPLFDINYGITDNDQFKIEFAVLSNDRHNEEDHWGISDVNVGYKYRFLEEKDFGWMVSIFLSASQLPDGQ